MSFGYDPELPAGFQEADLEMAAMEEESRCVSHLNRRGICTHSWGLTGGASMNISRGGDRGRPCAGQVSAAAHRSKHRVPKRYSCRTGALPGLRDAGGRPTGRREVLMAIVLVPGDKVLVRDQYLDRWYETEVTRVFNRGDLLEVRNPFAQQDDHQATVRVDPNTVRLPKTRR